MDRDNFFITHIVDEISNIEYFVDSMSFEVFVTDEKTKHAVERSLEIIGEAAKNVSEKTRILYQDIPWRDIAGLRDKIAHHYFDVDYNTLWDVIKYDLIILKESLKKEI
jgi:uncharacterized protein with HEPN domain